MNNLIDGRAIAAQLGRPPLHFLRFHPLYRLRDLPQTPAETLERAGGSLVPAHGPPRVEDDTGERIELERYRQELDDGVSRPDGGHRALVLVAERWRRILAGEP